MKPELQEDRVIDLGDAVAETKGGGIVSFDENGLQLPAAGLADD